MARSLLPRHPPVALLMAQYIANFSVTELLVSVAFSGVIQDADSKITSIIFHHIRNISDRIKVLGEVAVASDTDEGRAVAPLIEALNIANKRRVILAHGVWGQRDDGSLLIYTNLTDKVRKSTEMPIDEPTLASWVDDLEALNASLVALGFNPASPEHLQENGS